MAKHQALCEGIVLAALSASLTACSGMANEPGADETASASTEPIINGTTLSLNQVWNVGLVAVYLYDPPNNRWWPRPCSGKIIKSVGGVSKVITARHCVTTTGAISGTVMAPSQFRLLPAVSPGPPNPIPPAPALTPSSVVGAPVDSTIPEGLRDQAVITVNVDWSAQAASKDNLWVGDPSLLVGFALTSYGYGINVADWNCETDLSTVGAGVARTGGPFNILSGTRNKTYGSYVFQNSNASGQGVICGDSGGPDMLALFASSPPKYYYIGTHSTGGPSSASSPIPSFWLQQQLGGGYMSAYFSTLDVGIDLRGVVSAFNVGDPNTIGFAYHNDLKQVRVVVSSSVCLAFGVRSSDGTVGAITESCGTGGNNETWDLTLNQQLKNRGADGMCLTLSSNNRLDLKPCLDSRDGNVWKQRWQFHPQP